MRPPPDIEPFTPAEIDEAIELELKRRHSVRADRWNNAGRLIVLGMVAGAALMAGIMSARSEPIDGNRIYVIDGDTIRLPSGERVRILNIDAPETIRARCEAEAALGYRAKERLARLLAGARVTLDRCDGSRCTDSNGRTLARVQANGRDVGEALIREGLATLWPERFDGCGLRRSP